MKESIWTKRFSLTKDGLTTTCPKCQKSKLHFFDYREHITEEGKELEMHNYPYGIEHFFNGFLKCSGCDQIVTISGKIDKEISDSGHDSRGEYYERYFDHYYPSFYEPNIRYFKITDKIPKEIAKVIDLAFRHYFNDLNASANKVRTAIELILDDIKAPKGRRKKDQTRIVKFRNLHDRIENYAKQNKSLSILMLANKYIGNDGSHPSELTKEEVLDAFDNLEEIVDRVYIKRQQSLIEKANRLIDERKRK